MPYSDAKKQREARARLYRERYANDAEFRAAEQARKANWLQTDRGRISNDLATKRHRRKKGDG